VTPEARVAAVERLTDMRERVADWTLEGQDTQILRAGLKKTYGRARKAFRQARDDGGQTQLHDWRKRVKYHGYHCRLLREAWPDTMRARIRSLDDLSTCLGDERDYQQFRRWLNSPQSGLSPESAACAAELAARRAERLREAAFATAPRLLEEKKGALARRITGYWASAPAIDRKSR